MSALSYFAVPRFLMGRAPRFASFGNNAVGTLFLRCNDKMQECIMHDTVTLQHGYAIQPAQESATKIYD